jgi:Uncharacterized protein conserved in bacteria (DUF2252)
MVRILFPPAASLVRTVIEAISVAPIEAHARFRREATDPLLEQTGFEPSACENGSTANNCLRDAKISAVVEGFDLNLMQIYAGLCAWALARAHARSGDAAMIAGYMGASGTFDDAIGEFQFLGLGRRGDDGLGRGLKSEVISVGAAA